MSPGLETLRDAIDVHVHTAPDVVARRYTDLELATCAREAGLRGVVLKCHHESTVGRAAAATEATGIEVYGGLVLNAGTSGGVSTTAVETALYLGARIVWWPTVTSAAHRTVFGGIETPEPPIDGRVVEEICRLIAAHDAVLATGHAGKSTVWRLAEIAEVARARLLVTHADFWVPDLDVDEQARLAAAHANVWFERCAYTCLPGTPRPRPVEHVVEGILATGGGARNVVSSDLGQPELPAYPGGLLDFVALLVDGGIPEEAVRTMLVEQPARLLGVEEALVA